MSESALTNAQAEAAMSVYEVVFGRRSLTRALAAARGAQARHLVYCTLRRFNQLDAIAAALRRPRRGRGQTAAEGKLRSLLAVAIGQAEAAPAAGRAAIVSAAVSAAALLCGESKRGFVNAVLRRFGREGVEIKAAVCRRAAVRFAHPQWWLDKLRAQYPGCWREIAGHANAPPPLTLRVNRRRVGRAEYLARLAAAGVEAAAAGEDDAVVLRRACAVADIPGFAEGLASVQDAAMQRAAKIAAVKDGMRVVDCCAAPGGKSAHLLERADIALAAADVSAARLRLAADNFERLGLTAELICADARDLPRKLGGRRFDLAVVDAPCSASGVARRHPDIKWLRREADLAAFAARQGDLLAAAARLVAPGGRLLYATCSLFREENERVARAAAARRENRLALELTDAVLPAALYDGAFYALFAKGA